MRGMKVDELWLEVTLTSGPIHRQSAGPRRRNQFAYLRSDLWGRRDPSFSLDAPAAPLSRDARHPPRVTFINNGWMPRARHFSTET